MSGDGSQSVSFEYYAAKLLNAWVNKEQELHIGMAEREPSNDVIRSSLHHFKIARNFSGYENEDKYSVLSALCREHANRMTGSNYIDKVTDLSEAFYEKFGQRNLSAATKLLWLRKQWPVKIYDKNARTALGLSAGVEYSDYVDAWSQEFSIHEKVIRNSLKDLATVKKYTAAWMWSDRDIKETISAPWFADRVFDFYLWEVGGNKEPK